MKKYGRCRLCGEHRELTFEHIPPQGAFNKGSIRLHGYDNMFNEQSVLYGKSSKSPRGAGRHTLCAQCQTRTGSWYARYYIDFAHEMHRNLSDLKQPHHTYHISPFKVLKHALTMFASLESTDYLLDIPKYRAYLLNPSSREMPDGCNVYLYCHIDQGVSRLNGWSVQSDGPGHMVQCWEMAYAPIGLVMCFYRGKPHPYLKCITDWCSYGEDEIAEVRMRPFVLTIPKDFREGMSANYDKVFDINKRQIF